MTNTTLLYRTFYDPDAFAIGHYFYLGVDRYQDTKVGYDTLDNVAENYLFFPRVQVEAENRGELANPVEKTAMFYSDTFGGGRTSSPKLWDFDSQFQKSV